MHDTSNSSHKYKHITISGLPGCGSTTLLSGLREDEHLRVHGWKGFSGGEFMRVYAEEKGLFNKESGHHHSSAHYEDDFDRQVDMGMREKLLSERHWILESWLSGFVAQGVPSVLKVLMVCSEDAVRIDRIVNRDGVSVAEAKENVAQRYNENLTKWQRMYHEQWQEWVVDQGTLSADDPIDFWHPNLYDVVIDTYSTNKEQTVELILNAIQQKNS